MVKGIQGPRPSKDDISRSVFIFGPGAFFLALGIVTILFPKLILLVVALIFAFAGCGLSFMAWKISQARRKFDQLAKQFQGVQIQASKSRSSQSKTALSEEETDAEFIIYH